MHTPRFRRAGVLVALAVSLVFAASASAHDTILFTATHDGTLTTNIVSTQGGFGPLVDGTPVVFHSFGSQAAEFPAGFSTVAGPFSGPGPIDVVVLAASAFSSSVSCKTRCAVAGSDVTSPMRKAVSPDQRRTASAWSSTSKPQQPPLRLQIHWNL